MERTQSYDYIIVGGGSAVSVVAARLAENPALSVCLIEAGPTDANRPDVLSLQNWPNLLGTELDYDYRIEQQARGNSLVRHSRGRVLGGCSSHNSYIAFRAPAYDMDTWQSLGCEGWDARATKPYFDKVFQQVFIDTSPPLNPLSRSFLEAAQQAGFAQVSFNTGGELQEGAGIFQLNARNGLRQSSSQAYLHPLLATAKNLTVLTNTPVHRVLLDEANTAYAVETPAGTIGASREIILCCGTFDTPKLLLLSGIGPQQHLAEIGIPLKVDLPGVGEHLIDHPEGVLIWETKYPVPAETTQYWEVGLFSTLMPASPLPDVMMHFGVVPFDWNTAPLGYPTAPCGFSLTPNVPRARSEGSVRLRSSDPRDAPVIDFRYFTDAEGYDKALLLAGMKLARRIARQPVLRQWIRRELAPGEAVQDDQELSEYARRTANTVYHPAGTCRMGESRDPLTVVDAQLRVKQVQRLRVADASIFPGMISVNPCMTCMMIGEKCADLLKQTQGRIEQLDQPERVYSNPRTVFAASFVGTSNQFRGVLTSASEGLCQWENRLLHVPPVANLQDGASVLVLVRPEEVAFQQGTEADEAGSNHAGNRLTGVIELRTFLGPFTRFQVRVDEHTMLTADIPSQQARDYFVAQQVYLTFPPDACQVLPLDEQEARLVRQAESEAV